MAKGKSNIKATEGKSFVAKETFRDAQITDRYIVYEKDSEVHFEGKRLEDLIAKGFVKEKE